MSHWLVEKRVLSHKNFSSIFKNKIKKLVIEIGGSFTISCLGKKIPYEYENSIPEFKLKRLTPSFEFFKVVNLEKHYFLRRRFNDCF